MRTRKLFSKIIGLSLIVVLLLVACDIDNKQSKPTKDDLKNEIISNYKKVAPTNKLTFNNDNIILTFDENNLALEDGIDKFINSLKGSASLNEFVITVKYDDKYEIITEDLMYGISFLKTEEQSLTYQLNCKYKGIFFSFDGEIRFLNIQNYLDYFTNEIKDSVQNYANEYENSSSDTDYVEALVAYERLHKRAQWELQDLRETIYNRLNLVDASLLIQTIINIDSLPETITLKEGSFIKEIKEDYDKLSDYTKTLVSNYSILEGSFDVMARLTESIDSIGDKAEINGSWVVTIPYLVKEDSFKVDKIPLFVDDDVSEFYTFENLEFNLENGGTTLKRSFKATSIFSDYFVEYNDVIFKFATIKDGNSDTYYTFEDALTKSSSNSLYVVNNTTFSQLNSTDSFTLGKGKTMVLLYDEKVSSDENSHPSSTSGHILRESAYVTLNISEGYTFNIEGTLLVNSQRAANSTKYQGHVTKDKYSILNLAENSELIIKKNGRLIVNGFVTGPGEVKAESGSTVEEALFIKSFRGGSATSNIQKDVFPFDQFTLNNIETKLTIESGSTYNAKALLYVSSRYYNGSLKIVGLNNNSLIDLRDRSIVKTYNLGNGKVKLKIEGNATLNNTAVTVAGVAMNSIGKDMLFDGTWSFEVAANSTLKINSMVAFLPGSVVEIKETGKVEISETGRVTLFNPYEYIDDYNSYPNTSENYYRKQPKFSFDKFATFTNKGSLVVKGALAGRVYGNEPEFVSNNESYFYNYVDGSASNAKVNSREVQFWNNEEPYFYVVAKPSTINKKKETSSEIKVVVKDKDDIGIKDVHVTFSGGRGIWEKEEGFTDEEGFVSSVYNIDANDKDKASLTVKIGDYSTKIIDLILKEKTGFSCPFIYSFDGVDYHFEHEAIPFAVNKVLQTTSYGTLRKLALVDNQYHVKIAEKLDEKSFVNEFNLFSVDYSEDLGVTDIFCDIFGRPHTIKETFYPNSFIDDNGYNLIDELKNRNVMLGTTIEELENGQYVTTYEATFERPKNDTVLMKLIIGAQKTELVTSSWMWFLETVNGKENMPLIEELLMSSEYKDKFLDFASIVNLRVEIWNGESWEERGQIKAGLDLLEYFLVPIDLSEIKTDNVKIRLVFGTGLYNIESVKADFSSNEELLIRKMRPVTAVFNSEKDVKDILNVKSIKMVLNDEIDLSYAMVPLKEGYKRGFFVALNGYYYIDKDSFEEVSGISDEVLLQLKPMFNLIEELYQKSLHQKIGSSIVGYVLPYLKAK
jgi:hypothetical protein